MGDLAGLVLGDRHLGFLSFPRGLARPILACKNRASRGTGDEGRPATEGCGSGAAPNRAGRPGTCGRRVGARRENLPSRRRFSSCAPPALCLNTAPRRRQGRQRRKGGPFVYRLGRQVFNLERGVRLPYGLPLQNVRTLFCPTVCNGVQKWDTFVLG